MICQMMVVWVLDDAMICMALGIACKTDIRCFYYAKALLVARMSTVLVWKLVLVFREILLNQWKSFGRMEENIWRCFVLHHCIKISPSKCCNNSHREI